MITTRNNNHSMTARGVAVCALAVSLAVSGCTSGTNITNLESISQGDGYQAQYRAEIPAGVEPNTADSVSLNAKQCKSPISKSSLKAASDRILPDVMRLSRGDLVEVIVTGDDLLSRTYKVSQDGNLALPNLPPLLAQGRSEQAVEFAMMASLTASRLYKNPPPVSVRVTDAAAARVFVAGAVFEPGPIIVGGTLGNAVDVARQKALGWIAEGRRLSHAVADAGGIRPDADLSHVTINRGSSTLVVDIRPALSGRRFSDVILLDGDQVEVPSRGCFQEALMVPSSVTAAGIKVYESNLTLPAAGNALSQIDKNTNELRYGTRFLQAVVGMNCVGGVRATNADRSAVLFSHNPVTGESIVVSRQIEDLERRGDRDDFNPYLLPGDAIACYDSTQTNILAIAEGLATISQSITSARIATGPTP